MDRILWIVLIIIGIVQIIMVIRFFEMASDIKDIHNVMIEFWKKQKYNQEESKTNDANISSRSSFQKTEELHDNSIWNIFEK